MTDPSSPVREGDLLANKYRVERVLGVGGMGIVVAARDEQLQRRVAIKFVRDDALSNVEAVQRFLREARAAANLKSDHVAKVIDVGTLASGAPFMVMEHLEGSDLSQVLEKSGAMTLELAAQWLIQTCEAVGEAHAAGIVHRDLKPQNLFLARGVGSSLKIKVLDFGISKSLSVSNHGPDSLTSTTVLLGSPLYMAPEQMRASRDVTARSDVWALGVVFFQLLTNRLPFEAETLPELCMKVMSDPPLRIGELRPGIPPEVGAIIDRCLAKNPADRFADAGELASALARFAPAESQHLVTQHANSSGGFAPTLVAVAPAQTLPSQTAPATSAAAWGSRTANPTSPLWWIAALMAMSALAAWALFFRHDAAPVEPAHAIASVEPAAHSLISSAAPSATSPPGPLGDTPRPSGPLAEALSAQKLEPPPVTSAAVTTGPAALSPPVPTVAGSSREARSPS